MPLVFLMGPTASRKTEVAVHLCSVLPCEIVSVDAAQVYRGLDIGTAKPSAALQAIAPHRLIDLCWPEESYSVARFCADAAAEIAAIRALGRIPLLVGGSMFYFHALEFGLSTLPAADAEVRTRLNEYARAHGWPALHERLAGVDPAAAQRIRSNDRQRIQRALEVFELTGLPLSQLQATQRAPLAGESIVHLALGPGERSLLHAWINQRFDQMLENGLLSEAEALFSRNLAPDAPVLRIAGYRQAGEYLKGRIPYNEMRKQAQAATRQLAKRQLTWLRHYPGLSWFDSADKDLGPKVESFLRQVMAMEGILDTGRRPVSF